MKKKKKPSTSKLTSSLPVFTICPNSLSWTVPLRPQELHEHVSIRWFDPLVVLLFSFHNLKAELLVKVDGALVVDLNVTAQIKYIF